MTRWSTTVIKVSGRVCSNAFKEGCLPGQLPVYNNTTRQMFNIRGQA